jgi:hopene-associated glycosyltransferase HpnB
MLPIVIGAISVFIWLSLLFARGSFWRVSRQLQTAPFSRGSVERVVAVIPARNEADVIGTALASLFDQDLSPPIKIVVVDDGSTDGTAEAAEAAAQRAGRERDLTIVSGEAVPPGWTGKLWAMSQGVARAAHFEPDYLLLTDADIRHGSQSVAALVAIAESRGFDLVSYMVKLSCRTLAEKALIPAFVFFFFKLYPPAWIASRRFRTAGAAGGCMLIRAETLERAGGLSAIRSEVIDDCALARAVKRSGGRVSLSLTGDAESIRPYGSFTEIGRMISRTAFYQLRHSAVLLLAALAGLCLTYLAPPALVFSGNAIAGGLGAAAWLMMSTAYFPMVRFYRLSPAWSFALPVIALFYASATLHSAFAYWRGRGGAWKGRIQDVRASG